MVFCLFRSLSCAKQKNPNKPNNVASFWTDQNEAHGINRCADDRCSLGWTVELTLERSRRAIRMSADGTSRSILESVTEGIKIRMQLTQRVWTSDRIFIYKVNLLSFLGAVLSTLLKRKVCVNFQFICSCHLLVFAFNTETKSRRLCSRNFPSSVLNRNQNYKCSSVRHNKAAQTDK